MALASETNLSNYEKCGEILTSVIIDKRLFALKCIFCTDICNNFADFIKHIEIKHISLLETNTEIELPGVETELPEADLSDVDESINPILLEVKVEQLDDGVEDAVDPFMKCDLNNLERNEEKQDDKNSMDDESSIKHETDDESNDVDLANESEDDDSSESEPEEKQARKNYYLDAEIDTNQEISLALIEGWEKLPILWNKNEKQTNIRKKREEALRKLSQELNKKFSKRIQWTGVQERLKALRLRYRNELLEELKANSKGIDYKPTWYFPKLHFLKETIKLSQTKIDEDNDNEKKSTEIQFTDEQQIQLIEIYESFPCLWNIEHVKFKSKSARENAIKAILALVNEKLKIKFSEDEIQKRFHHIRKACMREKHEQLKCEGLGTIYKPNFKYYSKITFLLDHVCPFKCPYCTETFKGREKFRVHKSKHTGTMPFTCSVCNKGLSSPGNLALHLRRHNQDYVAECKQCEKGFTTMDAYLIHMRQHTGEKPYFCEVCGKAFKTRCLLGRHKRRHDKRPSYFCEVCKRGFYEQIKYKEHMNIHNNLRPRVCNICGKGFTHLRYLNQHVLIHSGRKDYVCRICGKDFAQNAGLYWHMKTHGAKVSEKIPTIDKQNNKRTAKLNISSTLTE